MSCSASVLLSFIFLGLLSNFADACRLIGPRYRLASDTVRWSLELSGSESCIRGIRFNNVVVDKLMVISAPQIGHVTLQGTGFSYKAGSDFQGHDFFSLMVSGSTNKVPGNSTIEVDVSVYRPSEFIRVPTIVLPYPFAPHPAGSAISSPPPPPPVPANNLCGSSNDVAANSVPTANLCSTSTASVVGGSEPWRKCTDSNGGTTTLCSALLQTAPSAQKPGPSSNLFANTYYTCVANYYVASNGSDSNNGSNGAPWATLQHADSMNVGAGSCINVAPGTYNGVLLHNGGNAATATGYVVYRCQQLDACIVKGNGGVNSSSAFDFLRTTNGTPPNFVQIDGFEMVGQGTFYPVGVNVFNGDDSSKVASHHIWVLNSIVHGFGQSGLQLNNAEYFYAIHNTLYSNSNTQCDAQGSGISVAGTHAVLGYTPTADDMTNPNPLLGPTWQVGSSFFHVVLEWNVTYNNALTQCGSASNPYDTDGNGIIFDTTAGFAGNSTNYTAPMLAAFNVTYNNGGGGVHVNGSSNVTVANNTCYNNYLDPYNNGSSRACIDEVRGSGGTFINNIAVAIPARVSSCQYNTIPYTQWNNSINGSPYRGQAPDTFSNNLTDTIGVSCQGEVGLWSPDITYLVPPNLEHTSPGSVNAGTSSVGTDSTPAVGGNFALAPGSKAIGAGLTESYLPASSVDIGACASALTTCP
jgi:hypothetical protein